MNQIEMVAEFLNRKGWAQVDDPEEQLTLLDRSKLSDTYRVSIQELYGTADHVLRVYKTTEGGPTDLAAREFCALQALRGAQVAPRPFYCDTDTCEELGTGVVLMEHLAGRELVREDLLVAFQSLATVHTQPVDARMVCREDMFTEAIQDCEKVFDEQTGMSRAALKPCFQELIWLAGKVGGLLGDEPPVIVHGKPGKSTLIMDEEGDKALLVGWENSFIGPRYYDLARLVQDVKYAGFCSTDSDLEGGLKVYAEAAELERPLAEVVALTEHFMDAQRAWPF